MTPRRSWTIGNNDLFDSQSLSPGGVDQSTSSSLSSDDKRSGSELFVARNEFDDPITLKPQLLPHPSDHLEF